MTEVTTDLVGKRVRIRKPADFTIKYGIVRAVYVSNNRLRLLLQMEQGALGHVDPEDVYVEES